MPMIGDIRAFSFGFVPAEWLECNGQEVLIRSYRGLYMMIEYTYGGSGQSFALPDLRGRTIVGSGAGAGLSVRAIGEHFGDEKVKLTVDQMPLHRHSAHVQAGSPASVYHEPRTGGTISQIIAGNQLGTAYIAPPINPEPMHAELIDEGGGGQAHENRQPYLVVTYGIYAGRAQP
jgi:microcystin-dependent protein